MKIDGELALFNSRVQVCLRIAASLGCLEFCARCPIMSDCIAQSRQTAWLNRSTQCAQLWGFKVERRLTVPFADLDSFGWKLILNLNCPVNFVLTGMLALCVQKRAASQHTQHDSYELWLLAHRSLRGMALWRKGSLADSSVNRYAEYEPRDTCLHRIA